jgi:cell division protein FtsQ
MRRLSRTATRIHTLRRERRRPRWLRRLGGTALVAFMVGGGTAALWISVGKSHILPLAAAAGEAVRGASAQSGLVVQKLSSDGRVRTSVDELRTVLDELRGSNILLVDIDQTRRRIEELPWVKSASVHRRLPDTLHVSLEERRPLALAEADGGRLVLIDEDGEVVGIGDLRPYTNLPTVAGEGAQRNAGELLALLRTEPTLSSRVSGARRIGDRRWNVWIDGRIEVRLPEDDAARAWRKLARIQAGDGLLDKAVVALDLRAVGGIAVRADPRVNGAPALPVDGRKGA